MKTRGPRTEPEGGLRTLGVGREGMGEVPEEEEKQQSGVTGT